jgi:hypothetical protein
MYYEGIYETPEIKGVFFKIKKIKPTKLFAYQTLLGQVFGDGPQKTNDEATLEKCYNFILENTLFSKEKEGQYKEIQFPGLDNTNLEELDRNPMLIGSIVALFINNVVVPVEKK